MARLSYKSLFIILFFLLIAIVGLLKLTQKTNPAAAGWFNESWMYRKSANITNSAGSTLTNQRIKITLDTATLYSAGKIQSDCDDIRVTDVNGNLLEHWKTACNNASTNIYVKMSSIPTSGTIVYVYYGNSTATNIEKQLGTIDNPGTSCQMMKDQDSISTNGLYYVVPGGNDSDKIQVYCDTTSLSQGWTLVINNGAYSIPPKPTWTNAINAVNITGTISTSLDSFDLLLGLKHWNYLGNTGLIQMGSNPSTITKRAHYNSISLNTASNYQLNLSGETIDLGGISPGFYTAHNTYQFTTYDSDHDTNSGNCATYYSNTPWWYSSCWSGNIWGGGDVGGYQNKPFWTGSDSDYYNYGGILLGGTDTMKLVSTTPSSSEELSPAPIAYWKFDEGVGSTIFDSSINSNNGNLYGSPTWKSSSDCMIGNCIWFDGSDDHAIVPDKANLRIDRDGTWQIWLKIPDTVSGDTILFKHYNNEYEIMRNGVYHGDGSWEEIQEPGYSISLNNWHQLTVVRTMSDKKYKWYLDGRYVGEDVFVENPLTSTNNLFIGRRSDGAHPFKGFLDEIKIFNYARTAVQIKQDYAAGKVHSSSTKGSSANLGSNKSNGEFLSDGLVGYWKMDENTGTTTIDSSGNNNTGTITGVDWSNGKYGIGLSFNGAGDNITTTSTNFPSGNDARTVSMWVKQTTAPNLGHYIICYGTGSNGQTFAIDIYNPGAANKLRVVGYNNDWVSNYTIPLNEWHFITVTYDSTTLKLFVDGNLQDSTSSYTFNTVLSSSYIGSWYGGIYTFPGSLDEVRLYNRALSPSEVQNLYNWAPGPLMHWNLDEGSGTNIADKSGNNYNSASFNSPTWTTGKYGKGLAFDGNDTVNFTFAQTLPAMTISAWVNPSSYASYRAIVQTAATGDRALYLNNSFLHMYSSCLSTTAVPLNTWSYVTTTVDSADYVTYYVNGIKAGGCTSVSNPRVVEYFHISGQSTGDTENWQGKIDEVKIYNYARTPKQIVEDMNAGHPAGGSPVASQIGYWKFDEGYGTIANNSGYGSSSLNGTLSGTTMPTWTNNGKYGKALSFNNTNNNTAVVSIPNLTLENNQEFTISGWINSTGSGHQTFFTHNPGDWSNGIKTWGDLGSFYLRANAVDLFSGVNLGVSSNTWFYITIQRKQNDFKIYTNGKLKASTTNGTIGNITASSFYIGNRVSAWDPEFNGMIDEVKIYNYALTDEEIKLDYNHGSSLQMGSATASQEYCVPGDGSACSAPVAEWNFNERIGSTAFDSSGNNYNGTVNGATWTTGKVGAALNFNGTNNYVDTLNNYRLTNGSISLWFKSNETSGEPGYILGQQTNNPSLGIYQDSADQKLHFWIRNTAGTSYAIGSTNVINDNKWHHVEATWGSAGMKLYIDGILNDSNAYTIYDDGSTDTLSIGCINRATGYEYCFNGLVDQVHIFNYARTPAQIAYDYNRGAPVAHWKFDECEGSVAHDSAAPLGGVGNTGTITIGAGGSQTSLGTCSIGTSAAWTNGAVGKFNSSLNFDGVDDTVTINNSPSLSFGSGDFSISLFTYRTASGFQGGSYFSKGQHTLGIDCYDGVFRVNTSNGLLATVNFNATQNVWQHHVFTVTQNSTPYIKHYINGVLDNTGYSPGGSLGAFNSDSYNLIIGYGNAGGVPRYFNGKIDDFRIYRYVLTPTQVKTLYNNSAVSFN